MVYQDNNKRYIRLVYKLLEKGKNETAKIYNRKPRVI